VACVQEDAFMPEPDAGGPADPDFRTDLYRGTARAYDQYRSAYTPGLIADLAARTGADGTGRLLDLACGTGQVAFALAARFAEIWAVDQEPGMIDVARHKADQADDGGRFRFLTCAVDQLAAPAGHFDLVTIGNAFHRLPRTVVAPAILRWLRPGGFLALLWGGSPHDGAEPWQRAMAATMQRWQDRPGADARIPAGYQADRDASPDQRILAEAGFEVLGRYAFPFRRVWTADELAGFVASTAVLSAAALGEHAAEFDADLRRELAAGQPDGRFSQREDVAYQLARRPD
jgi:SAM-dependent methyltransferase